MATNDWIKKSHEGLEEQATNTLTYITVPANRDRMGLTGAAAWIDTEFEPRVKAYSDIVGIWKKASLRTSMVIKDLQKEKKKLIPVYRKVYTGFICNNPLVTPADRVAMGFPSLFDMKPTPTPDPSTYVVSEVVLVGPGVIEIHYHNKGSKSRAKPFGVHGAEVLWVVTDKPTNSWDDLTHTTFSTASPLRMTFRSDQRRKTLCFAARWENTRGIKGPLSAVISAVIP